MTTTLMASLQAAHLDPDLSVCLTDLPPGDAPAVARITASMLGATPARTVVWDYQHPLAGAAAWLAANAGVPWGWRVDRAALPRVPGMLAVAATGAVDRVDVPMIIAHGIQATLAPLAPFVRAVGAAAVSAAECCASELTAAPRADGCYQVEGGVFDVAITVLPLIGSAVGFLQANPGAVIAFTDQVGALQR